MKLRLYFANSSRSGMRTCCPLADMSMRPALLRKEGTIRRLAKTCDFGKNDSNLGDKPRRLESRRSAVLEAFERSIQLGGGWNE